MLKKGYKYCHSNPVGGAGGRRVLAQGPDDQGDQMSYFRRIILLRLTAFLHCVLLYLLKIVYSLFLQLIYLSTCIKYPSSSTIPMIVKVYSGAGLGGGKGGSAPPR